MQTHYRQGDVLLLAVDSIPAEAKNVTVKGAPVVLMHGSATGHKHQILAGGVGVFELELQGGKSRYLDVVEPVELVHEEHTTIVLPIGKYEQIAQFEHTPDQLRTVED